MLIKTKLDAPLLPKDYIPPKGRRGRRGVNEKCLFKITVQISVKIVKIKGLLLNLLIIFVTNLTICIR
jgi:hypothetical protein